MSEGQHKYKTQPKFQKLATIDPGVHCYNVYVKIESVSQPLYVQTKNNEDLKIIEALVYDQTSKINIKIVGKYADLIKPGNVIAIRNGKSIVFKEKQRLEIDIWGKITEETDHKIDLTPQQIALGIWLGKEEVYNQFQVPKEVAEKFQVCNNEVYHKFWADISQSHANNITYLLEYGLDVLLYEGQVDPDVPTNGLLNYIQTLRWSQMNNFRRAAKNMWYKNYKTVKPWGFSKVYGNFKIVMVFNAGHLVPHDQGEASQVMIDMFIKKQWA